MKVRRRYAWAAILTSKVRLVTAALCLSSDGNIQHEVQRRSSGNIPRTNTTFTGNLNKEENRAERKPCSCLCGYSTILQTPLLPPSQHRLSYLLVPNEERSSVQVPSPRHRWGSVHPSPSSFLLSGDISWSLKRGNVCEISTYSAITNTFAARLPSRLLRRLPCPDTCFTLYSEAPRAFQGSLRGKLVASFVQGNMIGRGRRYCRVDACMTRE